jgi:drug/metabolite transporter (DMT)-like permease
MNIKQMLLVALAALCTAVANLSLRGGLIRAGGFDPVSRGLLTQAFGLVSQPLFVLGFLLYAGGALLWFRILTLMNISTAYPAMASLTFVLVTVGSAAVFQESVCWQKAAGIGVILAGIGIVSRF